MDSVRKLKAQLNSDEVRARRQARRALREKRIYTQIQEALDEVQGDFSRRHAYLWSYDPDRGSSRKIEGHAGSTAAMYVSETFGDYNVPGTLRTRFVGMDREAGFGGHGITEGTLTVDVEIKPIRGITQLVEVPVYVKNGYMLQPGLMYHQGVPYVIAQSSIDEIMESAAYGDEMRSDRKSLFSPPKQHAGRTAELQVEGKQLSQRDMGKPSRGEFDKHEQEKKEREDAEAKSKARRKQKTLSQRPVAAGQMARLACEILVPVNEAKDEGYRLPEGSRVFVMASIEDLIHVKHESGVEVLVEAAHLS